jgi:hypothetical protein
MFPIPGFAPPPRPVSRFRPLLLIASLLLTACGGGGGSDPPAPDPVPDAATALPLNVPTPVARGERLVVTSPTPARIQIAHDFATDQRQVTLRAGSAELWRAR